jgi:GT2 family glycosyltransferase
VSPVASILVVTYRCRDAARECLASIYADSTAPPFELIVVDNASGDGTVEMVESEFPQATLRALPDNVGFAAGVNRAAELARGEYVVLLNPDTVVHPGWLEHLVAFAREHPEYGFVGGRTLDPDGTVNPGSCWGKPTLWSTLCFATMLSTAFRRSAIFDPESLGGWQRDSVREVDIVTGCLLLASRRLWEELGGFDERYFMYGEDVDLALRAAEIGKRHAITPEAVVTHAIGVSSSTRPDKLVLLLRGKSTLFRRHWPPVKRELGIGLLLAGVGVRALAAATLRRGDSSGLGASGWRPVWRERRSWLPGYPDRVADSHP